jgi:hypothetical protein
MKFLIIVKVNRYYFTNTGNDKITEIANQIALDIDEEISLLQLEEEALLALKQNIEKEYLASMEDYLDKKIFPYNANSNKFMFDSILDSNQETINAKATFIDRNNYENSK